MLIAKTNADSQRRTRVQLVKRKPNIHLIPSNEISETDGECENRGEIHGRLESPYYQQDTNLEKLRRTHTKQPTLYLITQRSGVQIPPRNQNRLFRGHFQVAFFVGVTGMSTVHF
jgi:hypothetical protein